MRIGLDIDGCVRDIHSKLVQVYRRELDEEFHWCDNPEKWAVYEISNYFSLGKGVYDFWFKTHAKEIYTKSLPFPDLYEIEALYDEGDDIIVLTDQPNQETTIYTLEWVLKHIPYAIEIHFTPNKGSVGCDVYFDDAPHHIKNIVSCGGKVVIRGHRWNEEIALNPHNHYGRVDRLSDFAAIVRGLR
jgi:hypothetical protein